MGLLSKLDFNAPSTFGLPFGIVIAIAFLFALLGRGQKAVQRNPPSCSKKEIYTRVKGIVINVLGVADEDISPKCTLVDDLGAQLIDFHDIRFRLEKAFNISVSQREMSPESCLTVADVCRLVASKVRVIG